MNDRLNGLRLMDGFRFTEEIGNLEPEARLTRLTEADRPPTQIKAEQRNTRSFMADDDAWYCRAW